MKVSYLFIILPILLLSCFSEQVEEKSEYNLQLSLNSDLKIEISWTPLTLDPVVDYYEVYKGINSESNFSKLTTIQPSENPTFIDSFNIDGAKYYFYKVRAVNAVSAQPFSNVVRYKATTDIDGDGYIENDCVANIKEINPGAEERCDFIDNNCNGNIDENIENQYSGTDVGECSQEIKECQNGSWVIVQEGKSPSGEVCDDRDNDCDGKVDNPEILDIDCSNDCGEGYRRCVEGVYTECNAPPIEEERCDGEDNNCNGETDEGLDSVCETECGTGMIYCIEGEYTECDAPLPEIEVCDNIDNNCDGFVDENLFIDCDSGCGSGNSICVEGHWVGCDSPQFSGTSWTSESFPLREGFSNTNGDIDNDLYIFGGKDSDENFLNDIWYFDKLKNKWIYIKAYGLLPEPRVYSAITYDKENNFLYLYGGYSESGDVLNDFWKFDLNRLEWSPIFSEGILPGALYGHSLFFNDSSGLILFGGKSDTVYLEDIYIYNIDENSWQKIVLSNQPTPRYHQKSVFKSSQKLIYLFGGKHEEQIYNDFWYFNLNTLEWTEVSDETDLSPRYLSSIFSDRDNIYLFGGKDDQNSFNEIYKYSFSETSWELIIDPTEEEISSRYSSLLYLFDNGLKISGGSVYDNDYIYNFDQNMIYSPKKPGKYSYSSTLYIPGSDTIYLFGGYDGENYSNKMWKYSLEGELWSEIETAVAPSPRFKQSIVYIASENSIYLYGGTDGDRKFSDLWRFDIDSETWELIQSDSTSGPGERFSHTLFYREPYLYLFGGYQDGILMDLYKFDLNSKIWSEVQYQGDERPPLRLGYSVTYSPFYNYLILFGGYGGEYLDDLWLFDPYTSEWISYTIGINKPTARSEAIFISDIVNNNIFLVGGYSEEGYNNDIWLLQLGTTNWRPLSNFSSDETVMNREGFNAVFRSDQNFNNISIFGGKNGDSHIYNYVEMELLCPER